MGHIGALVLVFAIIFLAGGTSELDVQQPKTTVWNNPSIWGSNYTTANGDLILGQIGYFDRLLFNQVYFKARRWWSGRDKTIKFPQDVPDKYLQSKYTTIASIRIYNKMYDGVNNSQAEILAGGVGRRYVKIQLSSNWGKGFKYLIQIFGR